MTTIGSKAAIVGVGYSEFAFEIPNKTLLELRLDAALAAVADAGLNVKDIDGLILGEGSESFNERYHMEFGEILGIFDKPLCVTAPMGGAAPGYSLQVASWAIESKKCKHVLIVHGRKESGAGRRADGKNSYTDTMATLSMHYPDYELPYGPLMATFYAAEAQRHMYEYGTTDEQIAAVAVAERFNGSLNPAAVRQKPVTISEVLDSPMISSPLHRLECCVINDGAVAFVVSSVERGRDLNHPPAIVLGQSGGQAGYFTGFLATAGVATGYSLTKSLGARCADDAFREAGVDRSDIDFVTLADAFASAPIQLLEDFGFCERGEGGSFVGDGSRIMVGGELPVNPHGGAISCNHAATNYQNYTEAAQQLWGVCGARQVQGAKLAVASTCAGVVSTHYVAILGRE
jgi:acetyl-CoA acetyltransferase